MIAYLREKSNSRFLLQANQSFPCLIKAKEMEIYKEK